MNLLKYWYCNQSNAGEHLVSSMENGIYSFDRVDYAELSFQ